jgi:outer membrane protein assembly factor BamA
LQSPIYIAILFFLFSSILLNGQDEYSIRLEGIDQSEEAIADLLNYTPSQPDSLAVLRQLNNLLLQAYSLGYLTASFDELNWKEKQLEASFYLGPQIEWALLDVSNIPKPFLDAARYRERDYEGKQLDYQEVRQLQEDMLTYAENHGFPLARIYLDSIHFDDPAALTARLNLQTGPLVQFARLRTSEEAPVSVAYLENYLGIREGALFDREKILRIQDRLRELPFLKSSKKPEVVIRENKAEITLFVERQKASKFDFLIGVLPTNNEGPDRRLILTGTLNAQMQNQFGRGEELMANFERLRPGTQELEVGFSYPYVLQTPFGADLGFAQYRRDSTFSDVIFDAGVRYLMEGGNYLKAFWQNTSSSLITVDQQRLLNSRILPENLDVRNNAFGLEWLQQRLDYRLNPRKGWSVQTRGSAGIKSIVRNINITDLRDPEDPDFDFTSLYDSLNENTILFRASADLQWFIPVFQSTTLLLRNRSGYIYSPQPIYKNEQFRIGGNRLLRGFDEESLFTTFYSVMSLEYRLLIDRNSYLYLFGDYGYTENRTTTIQQTDQPFGFGAGLTFQTPAGLFAVSLAVGSQQGNPVDFRNPKVHFGYVSFF